MKHSIQFSIVVLCVLIFNNNRLRAQSGDILDILYCGPEDATRYADKYFEPVFKGLGYGFNNGWYNTAATHQLWGFDFTFSANLAYVPDNDNYFTFRNQDYLVTQLESGTEAETPTLFGPNEHGPVITVADEESGLMIASFEGPRGAGFEDEWGLGAVPSPIIQVGVGLFKNTDLKLRYIPDVARKDFDYSVWGIGLMHDIGQWIPAVKKLPLDISVFGAYSKLSTTLRFEELDEFPGENQRINSSISGYTAELLVSKKISFLTLLAGFGYNSAKTHFNMLGTYDVTYGNPELPEDFVVTYTDPVRLDTDEGSVKISGGIRVQVAILTLHTIYSFNGYNLLNVGLGFSFR
jgi:hypothetical protein